jgi:hypothetical protein
MSGRYRLCAETRFLDTRPRLVYRVTCFNAQPLRQTLWGRVISDASAVMSNLARHIIGEPSSYRVFQNDPTENGEDAAWPR